MKGPSHAQIAECSNYPVKKEAYLQFERRLFDFWMILRVHFTPLENLIHASKAKEKKKNWVRTYLTNMAIV